MAGFSISADIRGAQEALAGTSKSLLTISRQTLGAIARGTVSVIKKEIGATTEKRTGELLKAYGYKVRRDGAQANVFPKALRGGDTIFPKAMALSYGTKNGRLAPRSFVQKGISYADGGDYEQAVQKLIDRELAKYWR